MDSASVVSSRGLRRTQTLAELDLAYKSFDRFGLCLLEERGGRPIRVTFPKASDLHLEEPPRAASFAKVVTAYCKEHAASREYGNWVLILERTAGTALAARESILAVSRPKRLAQTPKVGQRHVYIDGRRSTGEVVGVGPRSM